MRTKFIYLPIGILMLIGVILGIYFLKNTTYQKKATVLPDQTVPTKLAPEIQTILQRKMLLITSLLKNPAIIEEVRKANEAHAHLTQEQIHQIDTSWINSPEGDAFFQPFLTNNAAKKLIEFQELNLGFSEIFITDARGLNVAVTNKTSDYYQADEDWWTKTYNKGDGIAWHGDIEFDQSAQTEGISLYVPIKDPNNGATIGIAKSILTLTAIKFEL